MKIFAVRNLTEKTMTECEPWKFSPASVPSEKIRKDKLERQAWYRHPETDWQFYCGFEGANPNQRCSQDNPPKFIHAFCADFDVAIPDSRVDEVISAMDLKPAWKERSLGGNVRLVWILERPLLVETVEFCIFILQQAEQWLSLDMLPGLDGPAWLNPTRLLCNGAQWTATGSGPIPEVKLQSFFVKCGRDFRFKPLTEGNNLPLDEVEKGLAEKFPGFSWPGEFNEGAQGPSFWVEGSTSPMSAIVKPDGMFTFSAHAAKPFYSWSDILGPEWIKEFSDSVISKATADIWWDGKHFWRKIQGVYRSCIEKEMMNYFRVTCKVSSKPEKSGISPLDRVLDHIYHSCRVSGAAPFIFRPMGRIEYQGEPVLNICVDRILPPASEAGTWGATGNFPFLSFLLDNLFDPREQKERFLAWFKHFYTSGLDKKPRPGQNIYLMGPAGVGKTFTSRAVIGRAVGGFVDASDYLVRGDSFGSENYHVPLWCIDDETPGGNSFTQDRFFATLKKTSANQQFRYNKKFEVASTVEWMGRVIVTANLDYVSSRMLSPMDNTSMDKVCIFRCAKEKIEFPERYKLQATLETELPNFLRYIKDWVPPAEIARDNRYGYASYHESSLLDQSHQTSRAAPFKEILLEELHNYFLQKPEVAEWRGTLTQLIRLLHGNPLNDFVMRSMKIDQINRYVEHIQREGLVKCEAETGDCKTRVWVFSKPATKKTISTPLPIFSK